MCVLKTCCLPSAGVLGWTLDQAYSHRQLSAYYARNFGSNIPTVCYRSSYLSPYRLYTSGLTPQQATDDVSWLEFELRTVACELANPCCEQSLDRLVIRTGTRTQPLRKDCSEGCARRASQ